MIRDITLWLRGCSSIVVGMCIGRPIWRLIRWPLCCESFGLGVLDSLWLYSFGFQKLYFFWLFLDVFIAWRLNDPLYQKKISQNLPLKLCLVRMDCKKKKEKKIFLYFCKSIWFVNFSSTFQISFPCPLNPFSQTSPNKITTIRALSTCIVFLRREISTKRIKVEYNNKPRFQNTSLPRPSRFQPVPQFPKTVNKYSPPRPPWRGLMNGDAASLSLSKPASGVGGGEEAEAVAD